MAKKKQKASKKSKNKKKKDDVASITPLADDEKARMAAYEERRKSRPLRFENLESQGNNPTVAIQDMDHPMVPVKLMEATGTPEHKLQTFLLSQVVQSFKGFASVEGANEENTAELCDQAMALMHGIKPRDAIEGMLAAQMVAVHNAAMDSASRAAVSGRTLEGRQANINHANKLMRTYTAQMEALKCYRDGGQQKMIVEHVYVNEGGQAIVGTVNHGGAKKENAK